MHWLLPLERKGEEGKEWERKEEEKKGKETYKRWRKKCGNLASLSLPLSPSLYPLSLHISLLRSPLSPFFGLLTNILGISSIGSEREKVAWRFTLGGLALAGIIEEKLINFNR